MKTSTVIGEKIKDLLRHQKLSVPQFTKQCGLPDEAVRNVIFGRSQKRSTLDIIAKHLGVPVDYLISNETQPSEQKFIYETTPGETNEQNIDGSLPFDSALYTECISVLTRVVKDSHIKIPSSRLVEYSYELYLAAQQNSFDQERVRIFAQGMMCMGLKTKILSKM